MPEPFRIEGYAIVSADGMIADAAGNIPPDLVNEADQQFLANGLAAADVLVHGRRSHEDHPESAQRKRLVLTRGVSALTPHPDYPKALLWNPEAAPLEAACTALGVIQGRIAIIGGTDVYGRFLPRYHAFHLSQASRVRIPGGRPVFPGIPPLTADDLLTRQGFVVGASRTLDPAAGVSVRTFARIGASDRQKPIDESARS
jgi:dihydrofolate reductase